MRRDPGASQRSQSTAESHSLFARLRGKDKKDRSGPPDNLINLKRSPVVKQKVKALVVSQLQAQDASEAQESDEEMESRLRRISENEVAIVECS